MDSLQYRISESPSKIVTLKMKSQECPIHDGVGLHLEQSSVTMHQTIWALKPLWMGQQTVWDSADVWLEMRNVVLGIPKQLVSATNSRACFLCRIWKSTLLSSHSWTSFRGSYHCHMGPSTGTTCCSIRDSFANITDFSVEVRNLEIDPYFSRFLYGLSKFSNFLRILQLLIFFNIFYRNWESSQAFVHGAHGLLIVIGNTWG